MPTWADVRCWPERRRHWSARPAFYRLLVSCVSPSKHLHVFFKKNPPLVAREMQIM
jgi:hypothetical protein